jgi:hypothetical protein
VIWQQKNAKATAKCKMQKQTNAKTNKCKTNAGFFASLRMTSKGKGKGKGKDNSKSNGNSKDNGKNNVKVNSNGKSKENGDRNSGEI